VDYIKYLGLIIDKGLKWDLDIYKLSLKLHYKFKILKYVVDVNLMRTIYFAIAIWGGTYGEPYGIFLSYLAKKNICININ